MYEALFAKQGLSLDRLRSFLKVVDAQSITLAAPGDSIRQSQYSRQVSELEEYFGHELFARQGRTRVLTPAGERLAQVVRDAFQGIGDVQAEASGQLISFALGAGDSLLHGLVIPRIGTALAKLGRVRLSIVSLAGKDVAQHLDDRRIDFGLLRGPEVRRGLGSAALGALEYVLYAPRRLRTKDMSPDDVLASAPLALQQSEPQLNEKLEAYARKRGIALNVALACETFPQALRAVQSGHYASLLPALARGELPADRVDALRPAGLARTTTKIVLAWQARTVRVRPMGEQVVGALAAALRIG